MRAGEMFFRKGRVASRKNLDNTKTEDTPGMDDRMETVEPTDYGIRIWILKHANYKAPAPVFNKVH